MTIVLKRAMARNAGNKAMQSADTPSRVLVVDDNHQTVVAVSLMLEALGFKIDAANCGAAALKCLDRYSYDLVLSDLEMTDMMGDELAFEIGERWPGTCVAIMTGTSLEEMEEYREKGLADHWILKPFNMWDLETMLERIFHSYYKKAAG